MFVFVKDGRRDKARRNTHSSSPFVNDSVHDHKKTVVSELTHKKKKNEENIVSIPFESSNPRIVQEEFLYHW